MYETETQSDGGMEHTEGEKDEEGLSVRREERVGENSEERVVREYLECVPTALSEREYEWEMVERRNRKKNLRIRGIRTVGKGLKEEVKNVIKKFMGIEIYIDKLRAVGGGLLVELESFDNKIDILKRRGMLKGINLWIEDDYIERENEIQEWLGKIAKEEKMRGFETRVGYLKIKVNGDWYRWDERMGRVEQMVFQEAEKGGIDSS